MDPRRLVEHGVWDNKCFAAWTLLNGAQLINVCSWLVGSGGHARSLMQGRYVLDTYLGSRMMIKIR
jgi:hypothetical protein